MNEECNIINAVRVTTTTLVGYDRKAKFPIDRGNCFSMQAEDGTDYRIVNFIHENLEEAIRLGITYPIKIQPLAKESAVAIIIDERIPDAWYSVRYCECCCPDVLLPHPQRMAHKRQEIRGERILMTYECNEYIKGPMTIIKTDMSKAPKLGKQDEKRKLAEGWTIVQEAGECIDMTIPPEGFNVLVDLMADQIIKDRYEESKVTGKIITENANV